MCAFLLFAESLRPFIVLSRPTFPVFALQNRGGINILLLKNSNKPKETETSDVARVILLGVIALRP